MTKLEYARIYNNIYRSLNDFCRLMPCVKCPFYAVGDKCVFEKCRDTLQEYVFDADNRTIIPAKTADRLADLENRVGKLEELVKSISIQK